MFRYVVDEKLAESILHDDEHRVMGVRLRPFSCWHKFQLEHWNSPVLIGGATLWDLWVAAQICRSQYPHRPRFKKRRAWWHFCWWVWHGRFHVAREMDKFIAYLQEYNAPPKTWTGTGSAHKKLVEALRYLMEVTSNEEERVEAEGLARLHEGLSRQGQEDRDMDDGLEQVALWCKHGHPIEQAWNMPLGELVWMNVAVAKTEGSKIPLWTPMDEERMELQRKNRAEKIAAMAAEIVEKEGMNEKEAYGHAQVRYWQDTVERLSQAEKR